MKKETRIEEENRRSDLKRRRKKSDKSREKEEKGLRRESNPGHPHPKRVFYHLTTKPLQERGEEERV